VRTAVATSRPDPAHPDRRLTASLGVTLVHEGEPVRQTLERADQALYRAKQAGRDRVEVAG